MSRLINRYHNKLGTSLSQIDEILKLRLDDLKKELNIIVPQITSGKVWMAWRSSCYEVRNSVVHKGYLPTKSEARLALDTGKRFVDLLNSN